jgi:hypothetical protein
MSDGENWPTTRSDANTGSGRAPHEGDARSEEQHHDPETEADTDSGGAPEDPE